MRLKEARIKAGLGRPKCARLSGVDRPLLYRYEAGLRKPGIVNATKIAEVLGVKVDEIDEFKSAPEAEEFAEKQDA